MLRKNRTHKKLRIAGGGIAAVGVVCLVLTFGPTVPAAGASTKSPVDVRLQSIAMTRVRTIDPAADPSDMPTPGLTLIVGLKATDGRYICRLGDVEITRAIDDTDSPVPVAEGMIRTISRTGATQATIRTVSQSVTETKAATRSEMLVLGPRVMKRDSPVRATATLADRAGAATTTLTTHLGLPSPKAKALKRVEGKIEVGLGHVRQHLFRDVRAHVGNPLDVGRPKTVALEITHIIDTKVALVATGNVLSLGDLEFYDRRGNRLSPVSTSRTVSSTDGVGRAEMEYDLGRWDGRVDLKVSLYGSVETVEVPFVFRNVALP